MKKKILYLSVVIFSISLIGLGSCSENESETSQDLVVNAKGSVRITLKDGVNLISPRLDSNDSSEKADKNEANLVDGTFYIFKGTTSDAVLEKKVTYAESSSDIALTSGQKTIYFAGNDNSNKNNNIPVISATEGKTSISDFQNLLINLSDQSSIEQLTQQETYKDGYFFMTNVKYPSTVTIPANGVAALTLPIGRGMSKVNVKCDPAIQPNTGKLSTLEYMVRNNPTSMYYFPNYISGSFMSPFFNNEEGSGRYFDNGTIEINGTNEEPTSINVSGLLKTDGSQPSYAMENVIKLPTFGTYTYALLRGSFAPTDIYNTDGTKGSYSSGADFYRIQYIETAADSTIYRLGFFSQFFNSKPASADEVYINATNSKPAARNGGKVSPQVVKYLGDGESGAFCYYPLGIGNNKLSSNSEKLMLERNYYYYMTIKTISDCGYNNPEPVDKNTPVSADALLDITLQVAPWAIAGGSDGIETGI